MPPKPISGRCYCGFHKLAADDVDTVAICHCSDCKRWTGAPMPAFAAVPADSLRGLPDQPVSHTNGVDRWNCERCGSPLAARFDYLPGQLYVPLGILDQAASLEPNLHCHADHALPWLHLVDGLPREKASARAILRRD